MAVPDYQSLMLPLLKLIAEGKSNVAECLPALKKQFDISEEEAVELIPSGRVTVLSNRAHWARTYMSKAGLLHSPRRNFHEVTSAGHRLLASNPQHIDNQTLSAFEGFETWRTASTERSKGGLTEVGKQEDRRERPEKSSARDDVQTPEERLSTVVREIDGALLDEISARIFDVSASQFEHLIIDLLLAMGFGRGLPDAGRALGRSGDGGIDGVINEDPLGLEAVYIQAKRYAPENKVGRPAIQQFIGSLTGESATKGVFVTTSDFSAEARAYVDRVQQRVILINGLQLARLMVENGIGVRTERTYVIRSVDEGYFIDE